MGKNSIANEFNFGVVAAFKSFIISISDHFILLYIDCTIVSNRETR